MALAQIRAYGPPFEAAMVAESVDAFVDKVRHRSLCSLPLSLSLPFSPFISLLCPSTPSWTRCDTHSLALSLPLLSPSPCSLPPSHARRRLRFPLPLLSPSLSPPIEPLSSQSDPYPTPLQPLPAPRCARWPVGAHWPAGPSRACGPCGRGCARGVTRCSTTRGRRRRRTSGGPSWGASCCERERRGGEGRVVL